MTIIKALERTESIIRSIKELGLYDWEEITEHLPDSEMLRNEIEKLINTIEVDISELNKFFK